MDWTDLLIPFLFIGLPLLGKLLEKRAPAEEQEEYGEGLETLPPAEDVRAGEAWGDWPVDEESPDEEEGIHTLEARSLEPVAPEPLPVPVERPLPAAVVETLEVLEVDRGAEHRRFHRRAPETPAAPVSRGESLGEVLRDPGALRRAVLLAEVLGPPKALRE
jgi:hypothetical protein